MKRLAWNAFALALSSLVLLSTQGCASRDQKPVDFALHSVADVDLNRDVNGRPLSVVLAIYQLRSSVEFSRVTFDQYVSTGEEASPFGESVVSRQEVVVLPASKEKLELELSPETTHLGIVAVYRRPSVLHWHYLVPAQQLRRTGFWPFSKQKVVNISLHGCHLVVSGVDVELIPGQRAGSVPVCSFRAAEEVAPSAFNSVN